MKALIFDTGPLISLALNNLLWLIKPLSEKYRGEFYITESVKKECVDKPMSGKKFKFEALQNLKLIQEGYIKVYHNPKLEQETKELLRIVNSLFIAKGNYIRNVQYAEIETITAARILKADAVVIDEFITRALIENPLAVKEKMHRKLHTNIEVDEANLKKFKSIVKNIKVIRSFELVTIAYELGLFKDYYKLKISKPRETLLEGLLWAIKLNGCSVSEQEIEELIEIENSQDFK